MASRGWLYKTQDRVFPSNLSLQIDYPIKSIIYFTLDLIFCVLFLVFMSGEQHRKHRTRKSADCVREYFVREYRGYSNATAAACNAAKYHGERIKSR
jgi:hypothetical protein